MNNAALSKQIKALKIPAGGESLFVNRYSWSKRGGHSGNVIARVREAAVAAGWVRNPEGAYVSPEGHKVSLREWYGSHKSDNSFSISLELR